MTPTIAIATDESNPIKATLFESVTEWAEVLLLDPEREHPDLASYDLDLYHMARRRGPSIADLRRASRAGIATVNPYEGVRTLVDRRACARMVADAGVKTPTARYGRAEEIDLEPPLITKPRYELGPLRHDVKVHPEGEDDFEGERFVQKYLPHEESIKLYRLGDATGAVAGTEATRQPAREREPTDEMVEIADRIQERTSLELFEIDLLAGERELSVVDVNAAVSVRGMNKGGVAYERLLCERVRESRSRELIAPMQASAIERGT